MKKYSHIFITILACIFLTAPLLASNRWVSKPPAGPQLDSAYQGTEGLVGYWRLLGPGSQVQDLSGNKSHGTVSGATWTGSSRGVVLDFNGSSSYVDINNIDFTVFNGAFTISLWGKVNGSPNNNQEYFGVGVASNPRYILLGYRGAVGGDLISLGTADDDGGTATDAKSDISYLNNFDWHHIVGVVPGDATVTTLYIDGIAQADTGVAFTDSTYAKVSLGNLWYSGDYLEYLDGLVDNIKIYNRALSAPEVLADYADSYAVLWHPALWRFFVPPEVTRRLIMFF